MIDAACIANFNLPCNESVTIRFFKQDAILLMGFPQKSGCLTIYSEGIHEIS